ncbi:MAG: serine protease [Rhodobiaceae bacterium]|nr:serine protease [Rhodobiaceae bacterium]
MSTVVPTIDYYSMVSIPLRIGGRNQERLATGFFYERQGTTYLVSNWHVMSGRNTYTGRPISKNCWVPDTAHLHLHRKDKPGDFAGIVNIQLGNDPNRFDAPGWWQHPKGQEIDLAVIPIDEASIERLQYTFHYVDGPEHEPDMKIRAGMDIFILGFPLGTKIQGHYPIWKRGSIASEPEIDADGLPIFLVDSATREGMSGSPVYARTEGGYLSKSQNAYQLAGRSTTFLGVYSGRYLAPENDEKSAEQKKADDEMSAQIGRVWRRDVLDELIDNRVPGSYEFRP